MSQYLPRCVGGVEMKPWDARCQQYLATVLEPSTGMNLRSRRELKTLAVAIDLLCDGHTLSAADVLMSRFQAIELAQESSWEVGQHLELIPLAKSGAVPEADVRVAAREELRAHRLRQAMGKGKGRPWSRRDE
jgi:hypothetical protein